MAHVTKSTDDFYQRISFIFLFVSASLNYRYLCIVLGKYICCLFEFFLYSALSLPFPSVCYNRRQRVQLLCWCCHDTSFEFLYLVTFACIWKQETGAQGVGDAIAFSISFEKLLSNAWSFWIRISTNKQMYFSVYASKIFWNINNFTIITFTLNLLYCKLN